MAEPISRRRFIEAGALTAAGLTVGASPAARAAVPPVRRPNLLFIFPDQFRAMAMGFVGADPVQTPNLDRLAAGAVYFPNAVSNFPVCSPYRAMLLTGRWPHATGMTGNCNSGSPSLFLKPEERCFSDVLAEAGYAAGYIGKWHLDTPADEDARYGEGRRGDGNVWDAYTPPGPRRHGFTFWHAYGCCDRHLKPHYWHNDAPVSQPTPVDGWSVRHETDVAVDFILNRDGRTRDPAKPFALFLAFNPPHTPFSQVPDEYRARYAGRTPAELLTRPNVAADARGDLARRSVADYFAAVTGIDEQVGRLLGALDQAGVADDTIVVFTADHGEMMGSQGRMHKGVIFEESSRIPLLIRYPARLEPGHDPLHINVPDMMPTLLGLMGLGHAVPKPVQGTDYSRQITVHAGPRPNSSFFIVCGPRPEWGQRGVRTDRYTFAVTRGGPADGTVLLFDRQADPFEMRELAAAEPQLCQQLLADLNRWLAATGDPWGRLEWPLRSQGRFPVRADGTGGFGIDFEPGAGTQTAAPASAFAAVTAAADEVIGGSRSLKCDTRGSTARFHECLRLDGLLAAGQEYEVTYTYRVLATGEKTQFYTVVRSTADIERKAVRLYWSEPPGAVRTRTFRFRTGDIADHHLLFGVEYAGAILIDDIVATRLPPG